VAEPEIFTEESSKGLDAAERALAASRLVVFPTDTVFGLAAHPVAEGATRAIFAAKRRSRELTLPILVASMEQARSVAALDDRAETLAGRYWPGPLTLVLRRTARSRGWDLGEEEASVGVRIPDHPVPLSLLRRSGPLAATSANVSGEPTPGDCEGVRAALGNAVAVYLCWGSPPGGLASTVVDLAGDEPRVIREGVIPSADLRSALNR
jgi:tRNA threonylcarbamoyl adenosine modification protein (Sua5/YciO/YrdC/YwlC family)